MLDPERVREQCGLDRYLGEAAELSCVHRFATTDGEVRAIRVTSLPGLELDEAIAQHERSFDEPTVEQLGALALSTHAGWRWAFVPSPAGPPLRVAWDARSCATDAMLELLADAPLERARLEPLPRFPPARPVANVGLLADRPRQTSDARGRPRPLPREGPALLDALLDAAAANDAGAMAELLATDARWGLPDRRFVGARPIEAPDALLGHLRAAASRLPDGPAICPAVDHRLRTAVATGELTMWCYWRSVDGLDVLAVALRGHTDGDHTDGRVAYVGLFPTAPTGPVHLPGEPPAPPTFPDPPARCGDPHTAARAEGCSVDEGPESGEDAQP